MEFRDRIISDFAVVFDAGENEAESNILQGDFTTKWGWFGVMYRLTDGKIINLEKITKIELLECLTWLTYETDLQTTQNVNRDGGKQNI